MALTAEKAEYIKRIGNIADDLNDNLLQSDDLLALWNDRTYLEGIVSQDLIDANVDFTTTDLANMVTALQALLNYRDNVGVSAADRGAVINAVRKISP